jgi:hypothetical protein
VIQASSQIAVLYQNLLPVDLERKGRRVAFLQRCIDVIIFHVFNCDGSTMLVHDYEIVVVPACVLVHGSANRSY